MAFGAMIQMPGSRPKAPHEPCKHNLGGERNPIDIIA